MPDDWGGIERYVSYISQALSSRGHSVEATAPEGSPLSKRVGVSVVPINLRNKMDPVALAAYIRLFQRARYDVVNVHFSPDYTVPALAAKFCGQPNLVLTRHLAIGWKPRRVRQYSKFYAHIIGVSEAVRRVLVSHSGFSPSFVSAVQAGMPELTPIVDRQDSRRRFSMSDDVLNVGVFGRLTVEKGHAPLLEIAKASPKLKVHVFGDGPERARLESLAGAQTAFHGYLADVADALSAVDCIATPSLWDEAFSLATLEAFCLAKPVVASPRGALPELVQDGVNGFLADPESQQELFLEKLVTLADDAGLRKALGANGRSLYESKFTLDHFGERIERVYQTLTG